MTSASTRIALAALTAVLVTGCQDQPLEPTDIPEAQLARGGNGKGKPGGDNGGGAPSVVEDFWVQAQSDGSSLIHIAGSGPAAAHVGLGTIHDFFFNGQKDDDRPLDTHYEWSDNGMSTIQLAEAGNDSWHFDVAWDGERQIGYENEQWIYEPYSDFLTTSVNGSGADPFALSVSLYDEAGTRLLRHKPTGVLHGGSVFDPEHTVANDGYHGDVGDVTSYAVHEGVEPTGTISVAQFSATIVKCTQVTTHSGKGRNRTTSTVRRVAFDYTVEISGAGGIPSDVEPPRNRYWFEVHVFDPVTGDLSTRRTASPAKDTFSGYAVLELPDGPSEATLQIVLDFMRPVGPLNGYSYDAAGNRAVTTVGLTETPWTNSAASESRDDGGFPVVRSEPLTVTCR